MQDLQQLNIRWYRIPCLSTGQTNIISSTTNEGSATASSTHTHSAPPTSPTLLKDKNLVEEFEISCTTGLLFISTIFSRHHTVWMFKYVKQSTHLNWAAEFCLFFFHFILLPEIFCKRLNLIHQGREIFTHILYPHTAVLLLFYAMPEIIIMGSYCNCYSFNWHKKQQWGQRIPLFISSIYFIVSYSR